MEVGDTVKTSRGHKGFITKKRYNTDKEDTYYTCQYIINVIEDDGFVSDGIVARDIEFIQTRFVLVEKT